MTRISTQLGYVETKDALDIRINAHKNYSNFSLEDWFNQNLPFKSGNKILDLGCGNGNFFATYQLKIKERGLIIGLDQSDELLQKANQRDVDCNTLVFKGDINQDLPFVENSFDFVISTFAIYYVNSVSEILKNIAKVLKPKGEILLVGPTNNNAKELYAFNKLIFGIECDPKIVRRTNRLEKEFYPVLQEIYVQPMLEMIPSKIEFPSKEEFIRYYLSTLLFEESVQKTGFNPTIEDIQSTPLSKNEISKEMIILRGIKSE